MITLFTAECRLNNRNCVYPHRVEVSDEVTLKQAVEESAGEENALTYTDEQNDTLAQYGSDVQTYLQENYLAFLDNSKPLSEWDSYLAGLHGIGVDEVLAVYQEAYEAYLAG